VPGAARVELPADESHHLARVLRLEPGADVTVFDGAGREWSGRVATVTRSLATVELGAPRTPAAEPLVHVTLGIGWLKGDQMESVVRDATMLGVSAIRPIVSDHVTVAERAWRAGGPIDRWRRVAIASAKQCGRAVVPDLLPTALLSDAMREPDRGLQLICVEPAQANGWGPTPGGLPPRPVRAVIYVGPEGGWSAREIADAGSAGLVPVGLGPRTLRAEAAPTVALSVLWSAWGW
jgi:16S rRNA (uracil1498-N3)-methyltransferase